MSEAFQKEFDEWFQDAPITDIKFRPVEHLVGWNHTNIVNTRESEDGSYSTVYTEYWETPEKCYALKMADFYDKQALTCLYREYKIHKKMYDLYPEHVIKPIWMKKCTMNNGQASHMLFLCMERFDETLYKYLEREKETETSRKWKQEILETIRDMESKHGFQHRDLHINNIGLLNGKWKLFDFGMSYCNGIVDDFYSGFWSRGSVISSTFTERTLRFSWICWGDPDNWVDYEMKKMGQCSDEYWTQDMPVVIKNSDIHTRGKIIFKTTHKTWLVSTESKKEVEFVREDLLPDLTYKFIHYFLPGLP